MPHMDRYGHFTARGTYLIDTPSTPTRWVNTLFNDSYVLHLSQRMTGPSFRVNNAAETPVMEDRAFWLKTGGQAVSLFCGRGRDFGVEYDLGSSRAWESVSGIRAEALAFVPVEGQRECWRLTLTNTGAEAAEADLFCFFPFAGKGPMGGESRIMEDGKGILKFAFPYHVRYEDKDKALQNTPYSFALADRPLTSWAGSRQLFFGQDNPWAVPLPVQAGRLPDLPGEGEDMAAALHFRMTLQAGQTEQIDLTLGCAVKTEDIKPLSLSAEYQKVLALWEGRCASFTIQTANKALDILMNRWFKKQAVYLARLNRGGVYAPVRNQLQDALGYAMVEPEEAYKIAWRVMARQHESGYLKQWYMLDGSPERDLCFMEHSDACVWLILCVTEIIHQTGEKARFDDAVPFLNTGRTGTVLEHLKRAARYMLNEVGSHGLCLMKDGDWTDPINGAGRKGRGESVWNSMALIYAIRELTAVFPDEALSRAADDMAERLSACCWDQDRYIVGFDDDGQPYGTHAEKEANLFLNTQSWAFIAGIVPEERKAILRESIDRLRTPFGYLLLAPAFDGWNDTWGRISVKQKGTTENGSVYCHASIFKALGDCLDGRKAEAWETICRTLPTNPDNPTDVNLQLPLYVPNYYFGVQDGNYGKSSSNPGTGTNAWILWVMLEYVLGVRATVEGLKFDKRIPKEAGAVSVTRRFRGMTQTFSSAQEEEP